MTWIKGSIAWRWGLGLLAVAVLGFLSGARWGGCLFRQTESQAGPMRGGMRPATTPATRPGSAAGPRQPRLR